jgi:hypothetical protein
MGVTTYGVCDMKRLFLIGLMFWLVTAFANEQEFQTRGSEFTDRFLAGDTAEIWEAMTAQMQGALGSAEKLKEFSHSVLEQAGTPGPVVSTQTRASGGFHVFRQLRRFGDTGEPLEIQWVFDQQGDVAGFFVRPPPAPPSDKFEDYQTRTSLRLPFGGEWYVFWGGRERDDNYHVDYPNQRYAYDLLVLKNGVSYAGDPGIKENYHCWGRAILAPADGTVVAAEDGLPDQVPGEMDSAHPPGNHVIIDHGNEEYSLLAHLQNGSVGVDAGEQVKAGTQVGLCGNSGNTSEPHLHFHLQNARKFGEGHGLPTPFVDYRLNGEKVVKGEPVRGQYILPNQD